MTSEAKPGLEAFVLAHSASVRDAADLLNVSKRSFAMVLDASGRLAGTVTDGDLRRAYLAGIDPGDSVEKVMCASPITLSAGASSVEAVDACRRHRLQHLPFVDGDRRPIDVFCLEKVSEQGNDTFRTAVIMAGGEGKRLRPLTNSVPKPMLKINGTPILEHIITSLEAAGIRRVFLSVNYQSRIIEDHFRSNTPGGMEIEYLRETRQLGTAGSLSLLPRLDEPFIVMNGDVLTTVDFAQLFAFHVKHRGIMTVTATEYRVKVPYGILETANHFLMNISEKPDITLQCNAGVYALEPEVSDVVPPNQSYDMTTLMRQLVRDGLPVNVFPLHEYWIDVGRPEDLDRAAGEMKTRR